MLGKIRNYLASSQHSKLLPIIAVAAIILAVPLTVILSQQQQDLRQRASEENEFTDTKNAIRDGTDSLDEQSAQTENPNCEAIPVNPQNGKRVCVRSKWVKENPNLYNDKTCNLKPEDECNTIVIGYKDLGINTGKDWWKRVGRPNIVNLLDKGYPCYDSIEPPTGQSCKAADGNVGVCSGYGISACNTVSTLTSESSTQETQSPTPIVSELTPAPANYTIQGQVFMVGEANQMPEVKISLSGQLQKSADVSANGASYSFGNLLSGDYEITLTGPAGYYVTSANPVFVTNLSSDKIVPFTIAQRTTQEITPEAPTEITPAEETKQPEPTTKPTTVLAGNFDASNSCLDINDFQAWFDGFKSGKYSLVNYNKWYRESSNEANRCK